MFGLFKKETVLPTFAPLVTDMHSHLLPMVDDGSKGVEESIEIMEAMRATGFEEVRLTPHFQHPRFPNNKDEITDRYNKFLEEVECRKEERKIPEICGISGEYRVDDGFQDYVDGDQLLTFNFSDPKQRTEKGILLMEFSLHQKRMDLDEVVYNRQMEGYDIIIAHPERYPYFDSRSTAMERFKEQGVFFQVNILSLDGFYGEPAQRKAFEYIENGWVEFLGSDMHNMMYAEALKHASVNKKIIKLMEKKEFMNEKLKIKK